MLWARLVADQHGAPDAIQLEFAGDPALTVQLTTTDIALTVQTLTSVATPDLRG